MNFSAKQLKVLTQSDARVNVLDGPVRSGKTFSSIVRWIFYLQEAPQGDLLMSGKTKHTIRRNVLEDMFDLIGSKNYKYNSTDGVIEAFGRRIYIVGANDERAEEKIRGMTIAGWYDDETTLKPESFVKQAFARMSIEGAKSFLTTNPDNPYHWLNVGYLENTELISAGILKRFRFTFDDNPALSHEYKESLKKLYSGLWYRRMILGEWCMADGVVYPMFQEEKHALSRDKMPIGFDRVIAAIDYGTNNPCVFLSIGVIGDCYYVLDEYYHDGRKNGQKTDAEYSADLQEFLRGDETMVLIDPSASSLITQLRKDGVTGLRAAFNPVMRGISIVSTAISNDKIRVCTECESTLKEFSSYVWDEKATQRGEDKPLKQNDHAMDALRYGVATDTMIHEKRDKGERKRPNRRRK